MRSHLKRLAVAALLSLSCAGGTLLWYYATEKSANNTNEEPIAQVSKVGDEVLRRPATRLLWQSVNTGDNLYNGETIRTSARGELRIQFADGRYIDLEPDSLIVLQQSKGEISLDLMEGSLFVNAQSEDATSAAPGLVLNSKNGKVDLTGASASLSKGSGDRLDLQVLEGKAKMRGADGNSKEIGQGGSSSLGENGFDGNNLVILFPVQNKPVLVDPDAEKPIAFRWKGLATNLVVSVVAGPTRKELKEYATTTKAGETTLPAKLPLGKWWWRLVARDVASKQVIMESPLLRIDVQARYAPNIIFPTADSEVPRDSNPYAMTFKWQRGEDMHKAQLELGTDPELKKILVNKTFRTEQEATVPALKEGIYYWRMSAFYEGAEKPVQGKILKFLLISPGSMNKPPAKLAWALPAGQTTQAFPLTPELELMWKATTRADDIASYRIQIKSVDEAGAETMKLEATQNKVKTPIPKAGRYIAAVEAVDRFGRVIGKTDVLRVASKLMPPIPFPRLSPAEGPIQSGVDGTTELKWNAVDGAKEYILQVKSPDGRELVKKTYTTNSASLKNLMPGQYKVHVDAVDVYGRAAETAPPRILVVPNKSGIKAPTLKKLKVN